MKARILTAVFLISAAASLFAQLPPVVTEAPRIQFTESRRELGELIPKLGDLEPAIGEETEVVKDTFQFGGHKFELRYNFQRGRLYGWNALAAGLSHEAAITLADAMVPLFEARFGPAIRNVILPGESDGPPKQASDLFSWKVNGFPLTFAMMHSPGDCMISFGSQRLGGNGGDVLRVTSTSVLKVEVVSHHGIRGEYQVEEGPTNEKEAFLLLELARRGVTGTLSNNPLLPPDYGQMISSSGGRNPEAKTYSLEGFRVHFPITIFRTLPNESKVAETHFGMDSLFPTGLEFRGTKIDLKRYEDWRDDVPQRP